MRIAEKTLAKTRAASGIRPVVKLAPASKAESAKRKRRNVFIDSLDSEAQYTRML